MDAYRTTSDLASRGNYAFSQLEDYCMISPTIDLALNLMKTLTLTCLWLACARLSVDTNIPNRTVVDQNVGRTTLCVVISV